MAYSIMHRYPYTRKTDMKKPRNELADCKKCAFAVKSTQEDHTWYCEAEQYDINTLSCFVPRPNDKAVGEVLGDA